MPNHINNGEINYCPVEEKSKSENTLSAKCREAECVPVFLNRGGTSIFLLARFVSALSLSSTILQGTGEEQWLKGETKQL